MQEPTVLKKYSNRRLYDTRRSRYITLDELAQIVEAGEEISIVDAKSGEDMTRRVLMKLVLAVAERGENTNFVRLRTCPFCNHPRTSSESA